MLSNQTKWSMVFNCLTIFSVCVHALVSVGSEMGGGGGGGHNHSENIYL